MASTLSFTFFCCYLLVVPLLMGFLLQHFGGVHCSHLLFFVVSWWGKAKCFKTVGVYSMVFKVLTHIEEIGDLLDMYGVNCGISPN